MVEMALLAEDEDMGSVIGDLNAEEINFWLYPLKSQVVSAYTT